MCIKHKLYVIHLHECFMFSICYNPCNKILIFLQQILSMEYLFSQNILPNIQIFKSFLGIYTSWALTKIFTTFCKQKWRPSPGWGPSVLAGSTGAHFHKPSSRILFSQSHPEPFSTCPELQFWQWTASNHLEIKWKKSAEHEKRYEPDLTTLHHSAITGGSR